MLTELIRKEILEHLMSLRFAIACVLCFVVILCSLFVRLQDYDAAMKDYHENSARLKKQLADLEKGHPWSIIWGGVEVIQRPNPLKVFVRGVDPGNGMAARVNGFQPARLHRNESLNRLVQLFPAMDMVSFVGVIMSLLAIVFGYDAVCGEKERGTLRLMLSYSVPRDTVLLGKWIGGYVTLVLPFILAILAGAAVVMTQADVALTVEQWHRFAAIAGLALLFIAAVYSMAVWVSSVTPRSSTSIMVLVTIWLIAILAVPNLSPYLAQAWREGENPVEAQKAQLAVLWDLWQREVDAPMKEYDRQHGFVGEHWWENVDWNVWEGDGEKKGLKDGYERSAFEDQCETRAHRLSIEMFRKLDEKSVRSLDPQIELGRWISRVSPFSCFALAATELTDTGVLQKRQFLNQLHDYQLKLCDFAFARVAKRDQVRLERQSTDRNFDWAKETPGAPPAFVYTPPAGSEYAKAVLLDAGILTGMALVFLMLSYVSFLRYDVR